MKVKEKSEKAGLKAGLKLNIQKTKIMAPFPPLSGKQMDKQWENNGNGEAFYILGAPKSLQMVTSPMKLKDP